MDLEQGRADHSSLPRREPLQTENQNSNLPNEKLEDLVPTLLLTYPRPQGNAPGHPRCCSGPGALCLALCPCPSGLTVQSFLVPHLEKQS